MFGLLRLILALIVVSNHADIPHVLNLGDSAVAIFFLVSGYVMTATVRRFFSTIRDYRLFLVDRVERIFPQYLFWLTATILWIAFFDRRWLPLGLQSIVENVVLLPGMYLNFEPTAWRTGVWYIGATWSLALEWHFYLLLPFLLLIPRARAVAFCVSLGLFTLAIFGRLSASLYCYHFLPGVLFIFLLGSIAYDERDQGTFHKSRLLPFFVYLALLGIAANTFEIQFRQLTLEVYLGILIGLPLVLWLARFPQKNRIDQLLGNLSYGVFLSHTLFLRIIHTIGTINGHEWAIFLLTCLLTMIFAGVSYYGVEKPLVARRHALRKRAAGAPRLEASGT
jgi:peptidoglycan/LPS O-acetylase OafA/YrhL